MNIQMYRRNEKRPVVLFLPLLNEDIHVTHSTHQKLPLELLSLAGLLLEKEYRVILIDASIRERYVDEVISTCKGALCLGISCIFGYQVYNAATVARLVRERILSYQ